MLVQREIKNCPNCGSTAFENYCSSCGQRIYQKRFTFKGFFDVVGDALNIERGIIHTAIWMFANPGRVINDYLNGKTKSYFNPLNYILIITGIYAFLILSLDIFDTSIETTNSILQNNNLQTSPEALEFQQKWISFFKKYVNFVPLLMLPFASLLSKWYFYKRKLFYGEHLILNIFIYAHSILITILIAPLVLLVPKMLQVFPLVNLGLSLIYFTYALRSIFKTSIMKALGGAIAIQAGGFILFITSFILLAMIIVLLLNSIGVNIMELMG